MFELLRLINFASAALNSSKELVLATIVNTEGSSYRKTWTQMILADDHSFAGALSGGCVEKEVIRRAEQVFKTGEKAIFPYDGQYRLGCKGVIYVLLEKLDSQTTSKLIERVNSFHHQRTIFKQGISHGKGGDFSSWYEFEGNRISCSELTSEFDFDQEREILPQRQLIIVGSEHDSAQLALIAAHSGFQVLRLVGKSFPIPDDQSLYKTLSLPLEEIPNQIALDTQSALVLMTHTLSSDFSYLQHILPYPLKYLGVLGPPQRKEELLSNFMEQFPDQSFEYIDQFENMYGPVGLNIGGRTPEEIAVSILSEVVAVFNDKQKALESISFKSV